MLAAQPRSSGLALRQMDVSVIIPSFNHAEFLAETLARLRRQAMRERIDWEVIVVDNGCTDQTPAVIDAIKQEFPVPLQRVYEERQGVSWARNSGAAAARGRYLAFLDDDTFPEHHWLKTTWETFEKFTCDGVIGRIELHWRTERPTWLNDDLLGFIGRLDYGGQAATITSTDFPPNGGNMAFTRAAFDRAGGFNIALGRQGGRSLKGGEEPEFFARFLGYKQVAVYQPDSVVYHVIDKWRMRKSYFRGVHFHEGRVRGNAFDVGEGRSLAGVPLFMLSQFGRSVSDFVRSARHEGVHRSLRKEMNVWYFIGFMMGCVEKKFARGKLATA